MEPVTDNFSLTEQYNANTFNNIWIRKHIGMHSYFPAIITKLLYHIINNHIDDYR